VSDSNGSQYWLDRWAQNNTRWHQTNIEPLLIQHFSVVKPTTVLVPLCGKTKDLTYLASLGHHVVGVELSSIACEAFFNENQISYVIESIQDFSVYRSERIEIFCGDFFNLTPEHVQGLGAIYDRAASIALPDDLRKKYVSHLKTLIRKSQASSVTTLLIAIDYQSDFKGPPFAVSETMVRELWNGFEIERLESATEAVALNAADADKMSDVVETGYFIRSRAFEGDEHRKL
jgi:thiopurine S-methyltransferase